MEKLGFSPDILLRNNPKLIYARLSGYGQSGYYSSMAGHDINYLAITGKKRLNMLSHKHDNRIINSLAYVIGLLSMYGWRSEQPTPPCNYSEFAGGSLICVMGILLAIIERNKTGVGQIIDSNITEGVSYIGSWLMKSRKVLFPKPRGNNWYCRKLLMHLQYQNHSDVLSFAQA